LDPVILSKAGAAWSLRRELQTLAAVSALLAVLGAGDVVDLAEHPQIATARRSAAAVDDFGEGNVMTQFSGDPEEGSCPTFSCSWLPLA
jgi:hypothetical protein